MKQSSFIPRPYRVVLAPRTRSLEELGRILQGCARDAGWSEATLAVWCLPGRARQGGEARPPGCAVFGYDQDRLLLRGSAGIAPSDLAGDGARLLVKVWPRHAVPTHPGFEPWERLFTRELAA